MEKSIGKTSRIEYLDIVKGIGIILVVWAHAKGPYSGYMYQFHMPLFFLVSGFLHNSNKPIGDFVAKKIQRLYIPFVFWNLLIYMVKCFGKSKELRATANGAKDILLTLEKDGQFFGATWFLGALFLVSVVYKIVECIYKTEQRRVCITIMFTAVGILGFAVDFPYMISRTLVLGAFYALGVHMKEEKEKMKKLNSLLIYIGAIVFLIIGKYNYANMGKNEYGSVILFVIGAICASLFVIHISTKIEKSELVLMKKLKGVLCYLGRKSIDIVIWQFVFFRVVIIIQLYLERKPLSEVLEYYPVYSTANGWWIAYAFAGLVLSIMWCNLLRCNVWGKFFKKIHIV